MSSVNLAERLVGAPQTPTSTEVKPGLGKRGILSAVVPYFLAAFLLAPSLCWILLDRSVWPWDQAWYGEVSVELYYTLRTNPAAWPAAMIHSIPSKPPGLTWLGQFFVPLGKRIGSVDCALLLAVLLLQFITLVLIYRIGKAVSPSQGVTAGLVGCALVGAAPLFVGLSHHYMSEPLQTLAVTWFFYCGIMSPRWGRIRILSHLVAATAVAMLAKTTTPLYCLLPGLMATFQLVRPRPLAKTHAGSLVLAGEASALLLGLVLFTSTIAWYKVNWETVRHHAYIASFSDIALDYGHKDVFLNKFAFWFRAMREGLFTPPVFWMGTFLTLVGLAVWFSRLHWAELWHWPSTASCLALCAGLQVAGVLTTFSFTINEDTRFLTATVPVAAVLLMWAVGQIPIRAAGVVFVAVGLVQWGYVHAIGLGVANWGAHSWLVHIDRDPTQSDEVTRAIQLTSRQPIAITSWASSCHGATPILSPIMRPSTSSRPIDVPITRASAMRRRTSRRRSIASALSTLPISSR